MRGVLYASIFAFLLMACGDNNPSSSQDNEKKTTESSSSKKSSSSQKKSSSSKSISSSSKAKSSSSTKKSSSSQKQSSSSVKSSSSSFSYIIENDDMILDLKKMKVSDKRDGHIYDVEVREDSTVHMIQPINHEIPESTWCFNDYPANCERYGRLYKWDMRTQGIGTINYCNSVLTNPCPTGWIRDKNGTKGFYGGYRTAGGQYRGFDKVQIYWSDKAGGTMESNQQCSKEIYVGIFYKDSTNNYYIPTDWDSWGGIKLNRYNAVNIHCAWKNKLKPPEGTVFPKPDFEFPDNTLKNAKQRPFSDYEQLEDDRTGRVYDVIKIGNQTWMAENLTFQIEGSYCYKNDCKNIYLGRYYDWWDAHNYYSKDSSTWPIQGVCPNGWHIPTLADWDTLFNYVKEQNNGHYISKTLMTHQKWGDIEYAGTNTYGFEVIPSSYIYVENGHVRSPSLSSRVLFMVSDEKGRYSQAAIAFEPPEEDTEPYLYFWQYTYDSLIKPNIRCIKGQGTRGIQIPYED